MTQRDEPGDIPLPALLRSARGVYSQAIRARFAAEGFDDLPRNAPFVLGGMVNHGGSAGDLIRELRISRQAASQLVERLVAGGYLERSADHADGRRVLLRATDRGRTAAAASQAAIREVDEKLAAELEEGQLEGLRAGLLKLASMRRHRD